MGKLRGGGLRIRCGTVLALCVTAVTLAGQVRPAWAAVTVPPLPAPVTTTTLPSVPAVAPVYTAGQAPQGLLSTAVALSSLGVDDSALMAAVSTTQVRLDADAQTVQAADLEELSAARREAAAAADLRAAQLDYSSMAGAVRQAVVYLYMTGSQSLAVSPSAGPLAVYAQDYATSALGPYGVLSRRRSAEQQRASAAQRYQKESRVAAAAAARATRALSDEQAQLDRLRAELTAAGTASAAAVTSDHMALAFQAGKDLLQASPLQFTPKAAIPAPLSTTSIALTWAFAELGKPYVWGATGPGTFDCSGLTQYAWKAAGVQIPRVAADQDAWTVPVPLSEVLPGDLVFFGTTDIHHVGIYIGHGLMINAPHTGTVVQVSSIWWSDLAGFGRVHAPGTPVPPHMPPTATQPHPPAVVAAPGPVPSQTKPPVGWKPKPGESTPVVVADPSATTTTLPLAPDVTTTSVPGASTTTTSVDSSTTISPPPSDSAAGMTSLPSSGTTPGPGA